MYIEIN